MILSEIIGNLRIELQDTDQLLYKEEELIRAIEKSVSLMSRLIPKRGIIETTIVRIISGETLTITSSTGALAYKPIKKGTLIITGKALDSDYRIDYLTGVVTEVGSNLPDANYIVSYELDTGMLDLSSILPDYIKLERVEYPAGSAPPTLITFDTYGTILVFRGTVSLTENEHLRIIYLARWSPPTLTEEGDYPSHLNDAIIIGSAGQALIFKAEKYVAEAADAFAVLAEPSAYTFVKPSSPSLPSVPTKPTAPTLSFTAVETALTAIDTEITAAKAKLTSGETYINAATRGEGVATTYGTYGGIVMEGAGHRVSEAIARLRQIEETLTKYASEVAAFGSETNSYANHVSGLVSLFRGQGEVESVGANIYASQVNAFVAMISGQQAKANTLLDIAGRYLASGQSKINEMLIMLGQKPEFQTQKASSEQRS